MNNKLLKDAISNNCCYDCNNILILPGDKVAFSISKTSKIYIANVFEVNGKNKKVKVNLNDNIGSCIWIFSKNALNVSKQYNINREENLKILNQLVENYNNQKIQEKYVFGFFKNKTINAYVFFNILVSSNPGKLITFENVYNILKNKCKEYLKDIYILTTEATFSKLNNKLKILFFNKRDSLFFKSVQTEFVIFSKQKTTFNNTISYFIDQQSHEITLKYGQNYNIARKIDKEITKLIS